VDSGINDVDLNIYDVDSGINDVDSNV
jgi:hypothetical protein